MAGPACVRREAEHAEVPQASASMLEGARKQEIQLNGILSASLQLVIVRMRRTHRHPHRGLQGVARLTLAMKQP